MVNSKNYSRAQNVELSHAKLLHRRKAFSENPILNIENRIELNNTHFRLISNSSMMLKISRQKGFSQKKI